MLYVQAVIECLYRLTYMLVLKLINVVVFLKWNMLVLKLINLSVVLKWEHVDSN